MATETNRGIEEDETPLVRVSRSARAQEMRAGEDVHEEYLDNWEPAGLLDASKMPPRPGYVQRWVRTKLNGQDDAANIGRKYNQGWRPRAASTVPKGTYAPKLMRDGSEIVGMDGMILMERPEKLHEAHARRNKNMADDQMLAVDRDLFKAHNPGSGFGKPHRSGQSRVVKGRPANVADD